MNRVKAKDGKLLYHVTALDNLENIFRNGLLSRNEAIERGLLQKSIANPDILEKRDTKNMLQYVPFHFFEKTAFTGAVYKAHPETTFCVITIHRDFAKENNFKIYTTHPLSTTSDKEPELMNYDEGLAAIDWDSLEERNFIKNKKSKNSGMAECLAPSPVMPSDFQSIYVPTEGIKLKVVELANKILGNYSFFIDIGAWCTQEGKND